MYKLFERPLLRLASLIVNKYNPPTFLCNRYGHLALSDSGEITFRLCYLIEGHVVPHAYAGRATLVEEIDFLMNNKAKVNK